MELGGVFQGGSGAAPPAAGLVLVLEMNGVATGGGTYPDDTCKRRQRGEESVCRRVPASPALSPELSFSPVPYPGFEGIIPGHVIQQ